MRINILIIFKNIIYMKKSLLLAVAMVLACSGISNAKITVYYNTVDQPKNDTLLFALPVDPNINQEIWTTYTNPETGKSYRPTKYQPEYLVTAEDFSHGDPSMGTPTLPNNAKVIGLALDGFYQACEDDANCYQYVTAWCRNVPRDKMTLDYLDLFDGYNVRKPVGQLFTDTANIHGPSAMYPGFKCDIDPASTILNPTTIVNVEFGTLDDPEMPFWYTGENIYLTLWLVNRYNPIVDGGTHIEYRYMAYDNAEVEYASLMRSGSYCFNNITQHLVGLVPGWEGMDELMYDLPKYRLPAFRVPYFTNDARITCEDFPTDFELRDPDGNVLVPDVATVNALGENYYEYWVLDHTKEYSIYTTYGGDKLQGSFKIDNIYKDVDVVIKNPTAVGEVNVNKTVANVTYYNLAGQQSAQPVDGVNIVVTTYTDGSTTTAKVIK